jgi:ABC-type transporter Mla maintaining outer membrane lipid asymmetry ATPase subunit MlaF
MGELLLELSAVSIQYGALRPLRMQELTLAAGEHVALMGLDQPSAEVLINLITGATLPDTGEVRVFGRPTASITDSSEWLTLLDRFGIVSERAALLDAMTVVQNLAIPFSLRIDPPEPDVAGRAAAIAREVGLPEPLLERKVGETDVASRMRVRLGRALAFDPGVLLLEHPSSGLPRRDVRPFARDVRAIADRRRIAVLTITLDAEYAASSASRTMRLEPATGRLTRR